MEIKKKTVFLLLIFYMSCSIVNAQEMKQMAPPIDISGSSVELTNPKPANNTQHVTSAADENVSHPVAAISAPDSHVSNSTTTNTTPINANTDITSSGTINNLNSITNSDSEADINLGSKAYDNQILDKLPDENAPDISNAQVSSSTPLTEPVESNPVDNNSVMPAMTSAIRKPLSAQNNDIKAQAEEIEFELRLEEKEMLKDLRVLWSAAVEKSTTIRLAIQKLSNPNESEQIEQGMMSKLLSPLASLAPMAMMASGSATQAAGALIGGGMLGTLSSDVDNDYNRAFTRVSDYDLIMLAKEVDELQAKLVVSYYEYKHSLARYDASEKALEHAYKLYLKSQNSSNFAASTAADAFYREAKQNQLKAKQNFLSARTALEQLTGNDAIVYIEKNEKEQPQEKPQPVKEPEKKETPVQQPVESKQLSTDTVNK